jgi:outer membrane murein-binding lipoprotein Lpp
MEKVKLMFHGMGDVCRHIDAGIRITNDVLRVIELRTANLDEICLEVQKLNSANVKISKTLDKITSDVEDIKRDNNSKKTLNQVEKRLELMGKEQVVLR